MQYDKSRYKPWTWKHPYILHWIVNPGMAFLELVLGMRVAKLSLVEKDPSKSLTERSYVPCPHCNTLHPAVKWSDQNNTAMKNWFGLYCDHCGGIIPCIWNLTSLVILAITFPLWYWFKDRWKQRWLRAQKEKFARPMDLSAPRFVWWKAALDFGISMFLLIGIAEPLVLQEPITMRRLLSGFGSWMVAGLLFGLLAKWMMGPRTRKKAGPVS